MNDTPATQSEPIATQVVPPGPVTGMGTAPPDSGVAALAMPASSRARWARAGLLGIGAAALLAVAALALGSTASPAGILAAGTGSQATGSTGENGVNDLHGAPGFRGGRGFGGITITAISGASISLATEDGWTRTIMVDDATTYTRAGETIELGDLAVGDTIRFRQTLEDGGAWSIDAITVILPRVGGEVTKIDGPTVTLELRGGTSTTVAIGSAASIVVNGDAAELADIEVGMILVAEGTENADGTLDATRVRAGDPGRGRGPDGFGSHGFGPRGFDRPGLFGGGGARPDTTTVPEATDGAS